MAIDDQEEYEQGEQVRRWLRGNGGSLLVGVVVGLAVIGGWQEWQRRQELHSQQAADSYAALTQSIAANGDDHRLTALLKAVRTDYGNTPYATLASMRLASYQMQKNDAKGALATLEAAGPIADSALAGIVALREGRLLMILGRPKDALSRIASVNDPAFVSVADEIRGDAEHALGHDDVARQHYASALLKLPAESPSRILIEMKLSKSAA